MERGTKWLVVGALVAAPLVVAAPRGAGAGARAATAAKTPAIDEVAPGVFFAKAATEPDFEGANAGFVVQDDQVVVIEGSMPGFARVVRDEVARRTDRPIRLLFDTHDHWDHSFGNGVIADAGAAVVAHARCAELLATRGAEAFAKSAASSDAAERARVADARFAGASIAFDERLAVGRGARRIELLHFGRGHTRGDAVAWLPAERVLFTGDLCVNGAFNYLGDGDSESWVAVLDRLIALDPAIVCPGHGARGGKELLEKQRRWLVELRAAVGEAIVAGATDPAAIAAGLEMAWYQEWTGVAASSRGENVAAVFGDRSGQRPPLVLTEEIGLRAEGKRPRDQAGWTPPRKVVVDAGYAEAGLELATLKLVAPGVELAVAGDRNDALKLVADADAVIGYCTPALLEAGKRLRWVQVGSSGVEHQVKLPRIASREVTLTNAQRLVSPPIADHAIALALALTRALPTMVDNQRGARRWELPPDGAGLGTMTELRGETALVIGLGGIGSEIARRLRGFGAKVVATNTRGGPPPPEVDRLERSEKLLELAAEADLVFVCVPLTKETERLCDERFFAALKRGARLVNVSRGRCVDTAALVAALKSGRLLGAGLDVTDPEPLPPDHELWTLPNVVITPHDAARGGPAADERHFLLARENLRRFVAGEPLLSVVDPAAGY